MQAVIKLDYNRHDTRIERNLLANIPADNEFNLHAKRKVVKAEKR